MIKISEIWSSLPIEREEKQLVDARMLHQFLEVGTHFREWIRRRIKTHEFEEGKDYITFVTNLGKTQIGRPPKTYALTLDMAKELAMIEHNERGREARRYFIQCEKIFNQQPADYSKALREMADAVEAKLRLEK